MTIDASIASTCPARHVCRQHMLMCSSACPWHIDLRYQLDLSGLPDEYRDLTIERVPDTIEHVESLRFFASVIAERHPKNGLFLHGAGTGNGKTYAACAIAQSFIVARTRRAVVSGKPAGHLVQFVNAVELLDALRRGFDDDAAARSAARVVERIEKAQLVVIDDLGAQKPSEWVVERFYSIINGVWTRKSKQTLIVTSNMSLQALEMTLGARTRSRIEGLTLAMNFAGVDYRRKG